MSVEVKLVLPVLKKGVEAGEAVKRLQVMLNFVAGLEAGGIGVEEDGVFGPKTKEAVERFQANENLIVDGIVGDQTCGRTSRALPTQF